jgi:hypothetical protein
MMLGVCDQVWYGCPVHLVYFALLSHMLLSHCGVFGAQFSGTMLQDEVPCEERDTLHLGTCYCYCYYKSGLNLIYTGLNL